MKRQLLVVSIFVSCVLGTSAVQAHNPGYQGGSYGGWSGNVSIWGSSHGTGYAGSVGYSTGYSPAPPYAGAHFYPVCNHWHPSGYRVPRGHAYGKGYAHGYADGYSGGHHGKKHRGHKHKGNHH